MEDETNSNSSQVQNVPAETSVVEEGSSSSRPSTSYHHQAQEASNRRRSHHRRSILSYQISGTISQTSGSEARDEVWSCLVLLVTFWFCASMTMIIGFYGSSNIQLGPNCSRLIRASPFFVQSIKVEELNEAKPGLVLYGFIEPPSMDVETIWTETHNVYVLTNLHRDWMYYLNKGSTIDIVYNVKSPSSAPLLLAIAKDRESLVKWIDNPSYPNTTLSWNIIHGTGKIKQEIASSSSYYISVGNLNSEEVEVDLEFTIKSFVYNTTQAFYRCSLDHRVCSVKLSLLGAKTAVLTSPALNKDSPADDDWYVKLSYGPQWLTYIIGSGLLTVIMLSSLRICNLLQNTGRFESGDMRPERAPLLIPKDDDTSSWGSSYDSISGDEEPESSLEGKATIDGENYINNDANHRRLCVICFDSQRDCFFLPCGHCATCFTCGTRLSEEAGLCPICRRKMKKVRKIFTV